MEHLPHELRKQENMDILQDMCATTVRIRVPYTSLDRPDWFSDIRAPYPYRQFKGNKKAVRFGTGIVSDKISKVEKNEPCPCPVCQKSGKPELVYWLVSVSTATHVIYDESEAECAEMDCFYDSDHATEDVRKLYGMTIDGPSINERYRSDRIFVLCVTHDEELIDRLLLSVITLPTFGVPSGFNLRQDPSLIIVSHPHGCSKRVTVGSILHQTVPMHPSYRPDVPIALQSCPESLTFCRLPLKPWRSDIQQGANQEGNTDSDKKLPLVDNDQRKSSASVTNVADEVKAKEDSVLTEVKGGHTCDGDTTSNKAKHTYDDAGSTPSKTGKEDQSCINPGVVSSDVQSAGTGVKETRGDVPLHSSPAVETRPASVDNLGDGDATHKRKEQARGLAICGTEESMQSELTASVPLEHNDSTYLSNSKFVDRTALTQDGPSRQSVEDESQCQAETSLDFDDNNGMKVLSAFKNSNNSSCGEENRKHEPSNTFIGLLDKLSEMCGFDEVSIDLKNEIKKKSEEMTQEHGDVASGLLDDILSELSDSLFAERNINPSPMSSNIVDQCGTEFQLPSGMTFTLPPDAEYAMRYYGGSSGWFMFPPGTRFSLPDGTNVPLPEEAEFRNDAMRPKHCFLTYDTDTCPGSSGSYIHCDLLGYPFLTYYPHSGSLRNVNRSGVQENVLRPNQRRDEFCQLPILTLPNAHTTKKEKKLSTITPDLD